jgi:hypothetical protein
MDVTIKDMRNVSMDEFTVLRIHGVNALEELAFAYREMQEYERAVQKEDEEAKSGDWFMTAGAGNVRRRSIGERVTGRLFSVIISYQSSMEAIVMNAPVLARQFNTAKVPQLQAAADTGGFKNKWVRALGAVGEDKAEFDRYHDDFYKGMRIPVTHLGEPSALQAIEDITFKRVYEGVRDGWYAHARLVRGCGASTDTPEDSWRTICAQRLPHDLF